MNLPNKHQHHTKYEDDLCFSHNGDKEERCYVSGRLDGTAKYYYTSGAVETRIYENGVLQGKAVKQSSAGEVEERSYTDGKLNGKATVLYTDSSKEMRTYKVTRVEIIFYCRGVRNLLFC